MVFLCFSTLYSLTHSQSPDCMKSSRSFLFSSSPLYLRDTNPVNLSLYLHLRGGKGERKHINFILIWISIIFCWRVLYQEKFHIRIYKIGYSKSHLMVDSWVIWSRFAFSLRTTRNTAICQNNSLIFLPISRYLWRCILMLYSRKFSENFRIEVFWLL